MIPGAPPPALPRWTVLAYLDGDNELREHATENLLELGRAGSGDGVQVAASLHRGDRRWTLRNLGFKLSRLFRRKPQPVVQPDWRGQKFFVVDPAGVREVPGPAPGRPSDGRTLEDFLVWGMRTFPAERTLVVLSDHGEGHRGMLMDSAGRSMPLPELRETLERVRSQVGRGVDVLALEACGMGQFEVARELSGVADFLVASPDSLWGGAFRHDRIVEALRSGAPDARAAAVAVVEAARQVREDVPELAAVDLHRTAGLQASLDVLAEALRTTDTADTVIERVVYAAPSYGQTHLGRTRPSREFVDLKGFAQGLLAETRVVDEDLRQAARDVLQRLEEAVIARVGGDESGGLSLYLPTAGGPERAYRELLSSQQGSWDEYLSS